MRLRIWCTWLSAALCTGAVVGCADPPSLEISPTEVVHRIRIGGELEYASRGPVALELRSSAPQNALDWTLSGTPPWITPAATSGTTPEDVRLQFDPGAMVYGENSATLLLQQQGAGAAGPLHCSVGCSVLGQLVVATGDRIALLGFAGEPRTNGVTISVTSPGKPGLRWTTSTVSPWLVVKPASGETPATVTVWGDLSRTAENTSGQVVFTAGNAWRGSPAAIDVDLELADPQAVRDEVWPKLELLRAEAAEAARAIQRPHATKQTARDLDVLLDPFRRMADRAESSARRVASQGAELLVLLDANARCEQVLGLDRVRAEVGRLVSESDGTAAAARAAVEGIRTATFDVDARSGWQGSTLDVQDGDLVAFEARGTWRLGALIEPAGPEGLPTPSIADPALKGQDHGGDSVEGGHNHGCLLLRVGGQIAAAGSKAGLVPATKAGGIEARCNDRKNTDNRGTIRVQVAVISWPR